MKQRILTNLGLSALMLTGAVASGVATFGAAAWAAEADKAGKQAAGEADAASKAYANHHYAEAIGHAEAAVGLSPQHADYRMVLGQSYLMAGRFASARDAFADTLSLDSANGKAALDLALAQIATGDPATARKTLDAYADTIAVADRGLAIALAGDPASAVTLLVEAVRNPAADAKTRQNLALALALAGRWEDAKSVAAVDLAPEQLNARLMQWMTLSKPTNASDQVATLLGVTPAADTGQPVALALTAPASTVATASTDPIDAHMPGVPAGASPVVSDADPVTPSADPALAVAASDPAPAPASVPASDPVPASAVAASDPASAPVVAAADPAPAPAVAASDPAPATDSAPAVASVTFAPRQEVVQSVPVAAPVAVAAVTPPAPAPAAAKAPPRAPAKGNFFVQLGAYENASVAKDAWTRAAHRYAGFAGQTPQGMSVSSKAGSFYRLTVGGFARADAVSLCSGYRAKGGTCFVRTGAGDQVALWARGPQVASR